MIQHNVQLADKNWFQTGGSARLYCRPKTAQEFSEAVGYAQCENLEIFILGDGANILISDDGFDGLVIHPDASIITHETISDEQAQVTAGAGVKFPDLIRYCLANNLLGLEEFSGIPGTVGGSVFINIHYFEFLLSQFLVRAEVVHKKTGTVEIVDGAWFNFGYDYSTLHAQDYYLVSATFAVRRCTSVQAAYAHGRHDEIIRHRRQRYPNSHTCGSFFRNFHAEEVTLSSNGKKLIFVAYYLDKVGVKGLLTRGDAIVSYQHANMIVNRGKATSHDIIQLARAMQELVFEHFGIIPQAECQLIGFKVNPLAFPKESPLTTSEKSIHI